MWQIVLNPLSKKKGHLTTKSIHQVNPASSCMQQSFCNDNINKLTMLYIEETWTLPWARTNGAPNSGIKIGPMDPIRDNDHVLRITKLEDPSHPMFGPYEVNCDYVDEFTIWFQTGDWPKSLACKNQVYYTYPGATITTSLLKKLIY